MAKVKIVQIVMAATDSEWDTRYLDSEGRVWYDDGHMVERSRDGREYPEWVTVWKQVDLPDEPET